MKRFKDYDFPATTRQRAAIRTLEKWGFKFLVDFGTENAIERLRSLKFAMECGCLYEHLKMAGIGR